MTDDMPGLRRILRDARVQQPTWVETLPPESAEIAHIEPGHGVVETESL